MKMTPEHYQALRSRIVPIDTPENRKPYQTQSLKSPGVIRDFHKAYRWNLFNRSRSFEMLDELYKYLNDDHIDTALRAIVPPFQ